MGRVIYKGSVPPDDPRYQGGWNYLGPKNLNPHSGPDAPPPAPGQTAAQAAREATLFAGLARVRQYPIAPDEPPPAPGAGQLWRIHMNRHSRRAQQRLNRADR
jgi:hypothetical protein